MSLQTLAGDLLGNVASYLDLEEVLKLRNTTITLKRRLDTESIVKEVKIINPDSPISSLSSIGQSLVRLCIWMPRGDTERLFYPGTDWISKLPKTLVEIDFEFPLALSIWVRPDPSNSVHWALKSIIHGYAPAFLCEQLPELKHLRLRGEWTHGIEIGPQKHGFKATTEERDDAVVLGNLKPPPTIFWTTPMMALFVKKLPRDLASLEMPFVRKDHLLPYLPPFLTRLTDVWTENHDEYQDPFAGMPETLFESLDEWLMDGLATTDSSSILHGCSRFRHLQVLNISSTPIGDTQVSQLPKTLTNLTLKCRDEFDLASFARLPQSLTSLYIVNPPRPTKTQRVFIPGVAYPILASTGPPGQTENAANSTPHTDDLWSLLPSTLTSLSIDGIHSSWLASDELKGLRTSLHRLLSFSIYECFRLEMDTLNWVPCDRLSTLILSNFDSRTWKTDPYSYMYSLDRLLDTWPSDIPNIITKLEIDLPVMDAYFNDQVAASLPPKLRWLSLPPGAGLSAAGFLPICPRTLTHIDLCKREVTAPERWSASELLRMADPHSSGPKMPPHLSKLIVFAQRNISLPRDMTTVNEDTIERWDQSPANAILHHVVFSKLELDCLPSTMTSLDFEGWPDLSWLLSKFSSLKHLFAHGLAIKTLNSQSPPKPTSVRLETLRLRNELSITWLSIPELQSLTDLSFSHLNRDTAQDCQNLRSLTSLTRLNLNLHVHSRIGATAQLNLDSDHNLRTLFDSIPASVKHLTVDAIPSSFWLRLDPTQPKLTIGAPKLISLELSHPKSVIDDNHLRLLAPHLTQLSTPSIHVYDRIGLYRGLERTSSILDDLLMVQSLCSSVTELGNKKPIGWLFEDAEQPEYLVGEGPQLEDIEDEEDEPQWTHANQRWSMGDLDDSDEEAEEVDEEEDEVNEKDRKLEEIDLEQQKAIAAQKELARAESRCRTISALPRSLLNLKIPYWIPEMDEHLPPALTGLHVVIDRSETKETADQSAFFTSLPRSLKLLVLEGLDFLSESNAKALPPSLETLELPDCNLDTLSLLSLPHTLRVLEMGKIQPEVLEYLPPHLTKLAASLPSSSVATFQALKALKLPLVRFCLLDSDDSRILWNSEESLPYWSDLVDQS